MRTAFVSLLLAIVGCGGALESVDGDVSAHDARFTGFWFVDEEAARGGYSAAVFELGERGELALRKGAQSSGSVEALGRVAKRDGSITCNFGSAWRSIGERILVIETTCTDGRARSLKLEFLNESSTNAAGSTIRIDSVGGETDWVKALAFGWKMQKCVSEQACLARLR